MHHRRGRRGYIVRRRVRYSVIFGVSDDRSVVSGYGVRGDHGLCGVFVDDRVEAVHVVGRVVDSPDGAVRLGQTVGALDYTVLAVFFLRFVIACGRIVDAVFEVVRRIRVNFFDVRMDGRRRVSDRSVQNGGFRCCWKCITVQWCRRVVTAGYAEACR